MKCAVLDCPNHFGQGLFVGDLCSPCHSFLSTGKGTYSQLYRNTVAAEREACAKVCMAQPINLKARQMFADAIRARGNP